ncbi:MAG: hypothetical protein II998_12225 [Clostridia bacterium]|nr:hypothetical protein [Clostridia bacterium]
MKRIIALVISVMMFFSVMMTSSSLAAETSSDIDKESTILNQLGYITTIPEDLNANLTRGEFTNILLNIMKGDMVSSDGVVITDINEFHDYYPAMSRAIKLGLVTGPVTRADDPVTYNEAIKMTVCMLGYNQYALHKGGWPTGYQIMAQSIGLLDGISKAGDVALTYRDAIVLLYNAISADILEPVSIGNNGEVQYATVEGRTILTQAHGIAFAEGIVEAVPGKAIYGDDDFEANAIIIDGLKLTHDFTGLDKYVGLNVVYYYDTDTKALCAIYPENNNIETVDAESVVEFNNLKLIYDVDEKTEDEISFSQKAIILYNNVVIDEFDDSYFIDKQGEFTFVDNDGDGKFDIIFLDVTEDYVVKIADSSSGIVYDYYDVSRTLSLSDKNGQNIRFVDEFGREMAVSELMRYDVISVKKSLDGENVTAIYSNSEVRGAIEAAATRGGKMILTIDGKDYETTSYFANGEKLKTGEWGVFGLTSTGKIASINRGFATGGTAYGYLINAKSGSGLDTNYKYRILSQTNEVVVLTSAKKMVVDGVSMTAANAFDYFGGAKIESQPVVFETNSEGYLNRVDTIKYNEDSEIRDSLREMYNGYNVSYDEDGNKVETSKGTLEWRSGTGIFGSKIATSSNTVLFRVAETKDAPDEEYSASPISALTTANTYYTFKAYKTVEDSHMADIIVMYASQSSASSGNTTYLISEISESLDADGNPAIKLTLHNGKNKYTYYAKDNSVFTESKWLGAGVSDAPLDDHVYIPGDIIKLTRNQAGYINKIELVYDKANEKFYSTTNYNQANANAEFRISFNEVYSIYSNNILVHKGPIPEGTETLGYDKLESYNTNGFSVIIFDESDRNYPVRNGTVSDLSDYKTTGKGSMIFMQSAYTTNGQIIVYK